jgi:hypothetical protein
MSLHSKYGLLVKHSDIIDKSLDERKKKELSIRFSLDMCAIHEKVECRKERINVLITYFENRPGMIQKSCLNPIDQAFKILLQSDLFEIRDKIIHITGCRNDAIHFSVSLNSKETDINTGIHRDLDEDSEKIISKLLNVFMPEAIEKFTREYNDFLLNKLFAGDYVETDKEMREALEMIGWDKQSSGEA